MSEPGKPLASAVSPANLTNPPRKARLRGMAEFSQDLFDRICERIADGDSIRAICLETDMPSKASVMRWLAADSALSDQYARAREMQADHEFDEIKAIADLASAEDVQVARLRVDARKWRAGKLRPKVYGDKVELGGPGGGPLQVLIQRFAE